MEKIKLYLDEDLPDRLAMVMRSKGFDVISVHEVDMRGRSDKEQLEYAARNGRTIVTRNVRHFVSLQNEYVKKGLHHNGIVVTDSLSFSESIKRITRFLHVNHPEQMKDGLAWLQNYK